MTMGPVQVLVVSFGKDAKFTGAALDEIERLRERDIVRLIDLLLVRKLDEGRVEKIEVTDSEELGKLGSFAGALLGLGAAGEEGAAVGAIAGAEVAEHADSAFDEEDVWYLADALPVGEVAAIAMFEHRWAIPLRDALRNAGGVPVADKWLHPEDLVAIGEEIGREVGG